MKRSPALRTPEPMRRAWKDALLLLVVVLAAAGLAGCGGGGSSTSSTAAASVSTPAVSVPSVPSTATTTTSPAATATKPAAKTPSPASPSSSGFASSGSSSSGGAAASFRTQGGDNSIPDYGREANAAERARAAAALAGFLRARANGEWSRVCTYLTGPTRKQLVVFGKASKGLNGCGPILTALSSGPAASRTDPVIYGVAALRVKANKAFALFYGPKGSKYVMPMLSEGGVWKMSQLAPMPYPLGSSGASP
jgi:hypothetical protein